MTKKAKTNFAIQNLAIIYNKCIDHDFFTL